MLTMQIKVLVLRQSIFKHPCKQKSRSYKGLQAKQYGHSRTEEPELYHVVACCSAEYFFLLVCVCVCGTFTAICVSLSLFFNQLIWTWRFRPDSFPFFHIPYACGSTFRQRFKWPSDSQWASKVFEAEILITKETPSVGGIGVCNKWVLLEG